MKILQTTDTVGGLWTYSLELARVLAEHDIEVALASMGAPLTPEQAEEAAHIPTVEVFQSSYRLEWMDDPWDDVRRAGEWLLELEKSVRPAVVHLNGYSHAALPWQAPRVVVGHACLLSWWEAVRGAPAPPSCDRYREQVTEGLRAADMVVAPSHAMLGALEHHYGPLRHTRVIPHGHDPAMYPPGGKEPFVLSAGRLWDEAKNVTALDRVAPGLPWPVLLAGDDHRPDGSRAHLAHVSLLGRLSQESMAWWLARAMIYVLPAKYAPFGLSALEAALAGCALVLGDIPSLRENWEGAAVFVPPDDTPGLRSAIEGLIGDSSLLAAMAAAARERALQFPLQRMAVGYLGAYRDLLDARVAAMERAKGKARRRFGRSVA